MENKKIIETDLHRYFGSSSLKYKLKAWRTPGFRFTYFFRKASTSKFIILRLVYKYFHRKYLIKYGIQIPLDTHIGYGFYIGHFGNIVINENTIIGNNCNIAQGVTIGQENRGEKKGTPIINDCVWIGPNSVIVGKIVIGSNVLIAPNSYVNFDVPENSIIIGNPAKIINNINATEEYINNKFEII